MTAGALPGGIFRNDEPCWELVYRSGEPVDGEEGTPHYGSRADAEDEADDFTLARRGAPSPQQLDQPCWTAKSTCGGQVDGATHFATADDALSEVAASGMVTGPCGALHCGPSCADCPNGCGPGPVKS